jgi:hypothetical protein
MKKLIVLLCVLGGCALPDKTYTLDGVPVVLENRIGPRQAQMTLAVELFRRAAEEYFGISSYEETQTWRSLQEVRWTKHPVLDHAHYDQDVSIVYANWLGCALNVPLYAALMRHYVLTMEYPLTEEGELTDEDMAWTDWLHDRNAPIVCTGEWTFPW